MFGLMAGQQGAPQTNDTERRMREYDRQHGRNPDMAQVKPENDMATNRRIIETHPTDSNMMAFEQLYSSGPRDEGVNVHNSYEQNLQNAGGDGDFAVMDFLYNPQRSTNPAPYTEGIIPTDEIGPAEYGHDRLKKILMQKAGAR